MLIIATQTGMCIRSLNSIILYFMKRTNYFMCSEIIGVVMNITIQEKSVDKV